MSRAPTLTYEVRAVHGRPIATRDTLVEAVAYVDAREHCVPGLTVHAVTITSEQVYPAVSKRIRRVA
jgi:hypothetical protein